MKVLKIDGSQGVFFTNEKNDWETTKSESSNLRIYLEEMFILIAKKYVIIK